MSESYTSFSKRARDAAIADLSKAIIALKELRYALCVDRVEDVTVEVDEMMHDGRRKVKIEVTSLDMRLPNLTPLG